MEDQHPTDHKDITDHIHADFARLRKNIGVFARGLVDLRPGLDREGTVKRIKENTRIQGANAWLLMCSIMVASLGLDLNSPAVIIGAMLISPLMSPILGLGLGIATNDRVTLSTAGRHFGIAIGIAILTSTMYFFLTPFGNITEEILRRTEPTFLDVLVAFFGGIAGIISTSRAEQSNAIPGVAIATALMPPLCVTGFGLAKALEMLLGFESEPGFDTWTLIANSFYLFFLNSFFVASATFMIVRILMFPFKKYPDKRTRIRTLALIICISMIMIIPSFFILRKVVRKVNRERSINKFVELYLGDKAKYLDDSEMVETEHGSTLILKVYGSQINIGDSARYKEGLEACGLPNTGLEIIPTSEIDLSSFSNLQSEVKNFNSAMDERLKLFRKSQQQSQIELEQLKAQQDSVELAKEQYEKLLEELLIVFDDLEEVAYAPTHMNVDSVLAPMILVKWKHPKSSNKQRSDEAKIEALCQNRNLPVAVVGITN